MQDSDIYHDLSLYEQGAKDWDSRSWIDFQWQIGACRDGYEAIGNTWLGTVQGNYTDGGVEKTDERWDGEIDA